MRHIAIFSLFLLEALNKMKRYSENVCYEKGIQYTFVSTSHVKVAETVVLKPDEITTRIQDHHV